MTASEPADLLAKLHADTRIPPPALVGKLVKTYTDRRGVERSLELDYLGHAAVTDILLSHDPCWSWEPVALDELGRPVVDRDKEGWARGIWIRLTVHGHSRLGYGTCGPGKQDAVKELIGDALRNGAMRFGIGLSLWSKEEWAEEGLEAGNEDRPEGRTPKENRGSAPKDNTPRAGKPRTAKSNDGTLLRQDQAIAARAQALGLDDQTRIDVIRALTGKTSGKELEPNQVTQVIRNMQWLIDGFVRLQYDLDGVPSILDTHPPNPGPPG